MNDARIIRVFPRKLSVTPNDDMAFIGNPGLFRPEADEVHISITFTWDLQEGYRLKRAWEAYYPGKVRIGGPALGDPSGDFIPGMYLKPGNVMTSRGCPNKCWFCMVWKRERGIREIPITEGYNIRDDNLLACSPEHIRAVFDMLWNQDRRIIFSGGLEPARITPDIAADLRSLRIERLYMAYDSPDDADIVKKAATTLQDAGFGRSHLYTYVLIGHPGDTIEKADKRLRFIWDIGMIPYAMVYRDNNGSHPGKAWMHFQKIWVRPAIIKARMQANYI